MKTRTLTASLLTKSRVEARNQIAATLTPDQRKQFRQFGPWWLREEDAE